MTKQCIRLDIGTFFFTVLCLLEQAALYALALLKKIFYLENGLSLNNQQVGFISDICQLPNLADYILCFIDISDVSPEQTNLFHSSREEFANTQTIKI